MGEHTRNKSVALLPCNAYIQYVYKMHKRILNVFKVLRPFVKNLSHTFIKT